MRQLHIYWGILLCIPLFFTACEKDNITNSYIDENNNRLDRVAEDFRKAIASSTDGWVMMVKSNLSEEVYTPIVLKFDTTTNRVFINTVYGLTSATEDYFRIENGTGAPQLIFSTGSIMSTLYRVGAEASDITDHIFNVKSVSEDEIQIQSYRSGKVYSKEGGVTYKLFRRPADWKWADQPLEFDWTNSAFTNNVNSLVGQMKIEYLKDNTTETLEWCFWSWSNPTVFRIRDPFAINYNVGAGGFNPMNYFIVTGGVTGNVNTTVTNGQNSISIFPIPYNSGTNQSVVSLAKKLKTHYLIFKNQTRSGNNVKMEFEAYDKDGTVIVKAHYDNLR